MLTELCGYLRNWFDRDRYIGKFEIVDGKISTNISMTLLENQYIRIVGSVLNDGVYQYHADGIEGLQDEAFDGAVWSLAIPKALIDLAAEIEAWQGKYGGVDSAAMSPYNSESFGGYSYSKSTGGSSDGTNNGAGGWQSAFAKRLAQWRKI